MPAPAAECDPASVREVQARKLRRLLAEVAGRNPFYTAKFAEAGVDPAGIAGPEDLPRLPFTTKAELAADQKARPPYGSNLTYPAEAYTRLHQTSGTSDTPLRWLDTRESWEWLGECWRVMLPGMGLVPGRDRMFFPFSFGPFLGFWAGFEGAQRLGFRVLAGGGMSSTARLKFLREHGVTVVCATPTYALRLAEVAAEEGIDLRSSGVRAVLVAGEPGGSVPAVRGRIEAAWGARVLDHIGMTEVGPTGFECAENPGAGVHVIETEYVAEVLDPATGRPVADGAAGELVITNLGRLGSPLIRYRTGDLVRPSRAGCPCGRCLLRLEGGLLSRADDMIFVRGNNFYPSALESVLRRFEAVAEYRVEIHPAGPLTRVRIELEPTAACAADDSGSGGPAALVERVARAVHDALSFRAEVVTVPVGSLPRFEMKARRFVRRAAPAN